MKFYYLPIWATCLSVLASCAPQQSAEKQKTADEMFSYVMERVPAYADERNAKAMAACIKWDPSGKNHSIKNVPWYRVSETSDALFTANQLMIYAMDVCETTRAEEKQDCTCHEFAMNDTNLLRIP